MDFLKKNSRKSFTSSYIRKLWTWLNMIIWCVVSPLNPSKYEMKVSIIFPPCIDNFHPIIQTTFYLLPEFEESTWSRVTGVPYSKLNVARTRDTWDTCCVLDSLTVWIRGFQVGNIVSRDLLIWISSIPSLILWSWLLNQVLVAWSRCGHTRCPAATGRGV